MSVLRNFVFLFMMSCFSQSYAGVLLQGFYWDAPSTWENTWWDELATKASLISKNGFTAIWIPPVLKGASGGYSNGYDPYDDYDMGSKDQRSTVATHWGTREQLQRAIAILRANGLSVYVDTVLAHRNGDLGNGQFIYKNALGDDSGGRFEKWPEYFSGWNDFGRQLNHNNPIVRQNLIEAGDWLINSLGTQGLRIDMAKYVGSDFLREYLSQGAMNNQFVVAEYWSENVDELVSYTQQAMHSRLSVFDFPLWGRLKDMANSNGYFDMRILTSAGLISRLPQHSVTFVENHDTDRFYPTTANKHLAYAFILTSEGYPSVFWKDYFNYGLKNIIDSLVWVHEKLASGSTTWRWSDDDLIIFERTGGARLLVGLNDNQIYGRKEWVQTGFGSFISLHDYTGNGPDVRTEADGRVEIYVPNNSYVAYAPIGFSQSHTLTPQIVTQQFSGANDLDIPSATTEMESTIGRIWVKNNTKINWNLYKNTISDKIGTVQLSLQSPSMQTVFLGETDFNTSVWKQSALAVETGYYTFKIKVNSPAKINFPFWLKVSYEAQK